MISLGNRKVVFVGAFLSIATVIATYAVAMAQPATDFSLQVTPSPLVTTVKPGEAKDLELKIRNAGTGTEVLRIEPRNFKVDKKTGQVSLDDNEVSDIAPWISFSSPRFTINPGEWSTQKIHISLPKNSGFSYWTALVISRANSEKPVQAGRLIKGSVAVFTLIDVDRPGATRKLELTDFSVSQPIYESLPANFNISFRNTGNTIIQPSGSLFIQRGSNDATPTEVLPVNEKRGYLLPGSPRTLDVVWNTGFPSTLPVEVNGEKKRAINWDWSNLTDLRIGLYTAKMVAIYNDGHRDVPIVREVTFWVFPYWRILIVVLLVLVLIGYLRHKQIQSRTQKAVKKALAERDQKAE